MFARLRFTKHSLAAISVAAAAASTTRFASAAPSSPPPSPPTPSNNNEHDDDGDDAVPDLSQAAREFFKKEARADAYKSYFVQSYDEVADVVAHREREELKTTSNDDLVVVNRLRRAVAKVLMERLGYSSSDLAAIGENVDRMQGTGNPFPHANIQKGEIVLDLGSGFGVDAMLAGTKVGSNGRVVGVDLSVREVSEANKRVLEKGITNVRFYKMDIERLAAIPDDSIDVVISNGGFCLVPNKRRAFQEIRRVLKPKGRFSISCTTLKSGYGSINKFMSDETTDDDFPSCMEVFMPIDAALPLLSDIGFESVVVDESNSKMSVWDDVEAEMRDDTDRELAKLHGMLPNGAAAKETEALEVATIDGMVREGCTAASPRGRTTRERTAECQKDHTLLKFQTPKEMYRCNECRTVVAKGETMHGCRQCNFDVCSECTREQCAEAPPTTTSEAAEAIPEVATVLPSCPSFVQNDLQLEKKSNEIGGVHTNNPKYAHLSTLSMDDICARVVLYGVNPGEGVQEI